MGKPKPSEREIQEACSDFLALDGWRRVRTDLPRLRGLGVQEKGMADDLYIRYDCDPKDVASIEDRFGSTFCNLKSSASIVWIEWKRRTGKTAAHQHDWHAAERARGALTLKAGIDFTASVEGFQKWYFKSGLARRVRASKAHLGVQELDSAENVSVSLSEAQ